MRTDSILCGAALAMLAAGCGSSGGSGADAGIGGDAFTGDGGLDAGPPCEGAPITSDGVLDLDVESVRVHGAVTVNGAPLPNQSASRGKLVFGNTHSLKTVSIALGTSGPFAYDVSLSPGIYKVSFRANGELCGPGANPAVPCNGGSVFEEVDLTSDGVLDIDIPAVHVSGAILVNGSALAAESADRGSVVMARREGEAVTWRLGSSGNGSYQFTLLPGTYDLRFAANPALCAAASAPAVPCSGGSLEDGVSLTSDGVLDVDIPAVRITGAVTLDGAVMPQASADRGRLRFGAEVATRSFGSSGPVTYGVTLWPGSYAVAYEGTADLCKGTSPPPVPCNSGVVRDSADLSADGNLDIDLDAVKISGAVTLEEASMRPEPADRGQLAFGDVATRNFGASGHATYGVTLLADTYAVAYVGNPALCGFERATGGVPCNGGTINPALSVASDGVYDVDVESVRLGGVVTLDGEALPNEPGARGALVFAPEGGGQAVTDLLGSAGAHSYALDLWPGTYDVAFQANPALCGDDEAPRLPCTGGSLHQDLPVEADGVLDLDIPAVHVSGTVTLNGAAMPAEADDRGRLAFALSGGDGATSASFGASGPVSYAVSLWPGSYAVTFSGNPDLCSGASAPAVPCTGAVLEPSASLSSDGVLDLDIPAVRVSGAVTLNGVAMPAAEDDRGGLAFLRFPGAGLRARRFGPEGPTTYEVLLIPGDYAIEYEANPDLCDGQTAPAPPCNGQFVFGCDE